VAAAGTLLAAGAFVVRRRGDPSSPAINPLEVLGGCVAILAGLAALAGQFYGVGHHERPPPDARAGVQEIQTRVPRDEYLEALGKSPRGGVNGRQLGNVIWVRVDLDGYGSKPVELHWASYGTGAGAGELPRTYGHHPIPTEHEDHQRVFFPVWVGVPKVKFEVHIRVVRGDPTRAVRAMASTGPMRGDARRYVCRPAT
jgi:hypothetical protein